MDKFRTRVEQRPVDHTVGGVTYQLTEPHEVKQLVQPVDLDQIVSRALTAITIMVVAGAMAWSTVAIGTLLHRMAPAWVSYLVAVVFDMTWVACMGAEWLMRHDRRRARLPRAAGAMALAASVASIVLEGSLTTHSAVIGTAGAVISVLAKGLWTVVMMISAQRLSPLDQRWYEKAASAAGAELALNTMRRKLARTQARSAQERAALGEFLESPRIAATEPFDHPRAEIPQTPHQSVVYLVRNGDRVKIGTTTRLRERMLDLAMRREDVMLVLGGDYQLEQRLHRQFADLRIGTTEWFIFGPEIRSFVTDNLPGVGVQETIPAPSPMSWDKPWTPAQDAGAPGQDTDTELETLFASPSAVVPARVPPRPVVRSLVSGSVPSVVRDALGDNPGASDADLRDIILNRVGPDTKPDTIRKAIYRARNAS